MPLERCAPRTSYIDILDRVLDKGLVIDAWMRVSLAGIEVVSLKAQVVVASIQTYVKSSAALTAAHHGASSRSSISSGEARHRRRSTGRPRTFYRCQHGCTFALDRPSGDAIVVCPFDGGRACVFTPAPLA